MALEPTFILPVVILAKDLNHSEPQSPSLQNGYNNHCIELLGSNEFEPSIFSPINLENLKLLPASGPLHVLEPKTPVLHILVCSCHLGLSSKVTFPREALPDYPAHHNTLTCITRFIFFALSIEITMRIYLFCVFVYGSRGQTTARGPDRPV